MAQAVSVPDPVYDRISREAERQDVSRGTIVRDWMEKADKYDEVEERL
jgi:hypothetical protein